MKILATDIGGTNARVALLNGVKIEDVRVYPTANFDSISSLLKKFSSDTESPLPPKVVIAAAGVVENGEIIGTNLPWNISGDALKKDFSLDCCFLLNDFEAAAWGLLSLDTEKLVKICGNPEKEKPSNGIKAILGAGTGLGEAILTRCDHTGWKVIRSEGGHCDFAPVSSEQMELLQYLRKTYSRVSYEMILSGRGLLRIYNFLCSKKKMEATHQKPSMITEAAQKGDCVSLETLKLFCTIFGQEAGNLALKCIPEEGVFLYGGIAHHIEDFLKKGDFRLGFTEKGPMKRVMENIPVYLIKEPYLAILGCAFFLRYSTMAKSS